MKPTMKVKSILSLTIFISFIATWGYAETTQTGINYCQILSKEEVQKSTGVTIQCAEMKEGHCFYYSTPCGALTGEKIVASLGPGPDAAGVEQGKKLVEQQSKQFEKMGITNKITKINGIGEAAYFYELTRQLVWNNKGKGFTMLGPGLDQPPAAIQSVLVGFAKVVNQRAKP